MAEEKDTAKTDIEETTTSDTKTDTTTSTTNDKSTTDKPSTTSNSSSATGEDYQFSDYGIFSDAASLTHAYNQKLADISTDIESGKTKLSNDGVFMGPIKDNCMETFGKIDTQFAETTTNFNSIATYLKEASDAYKAGDTDAKNVVLTISGSSIGGGLSGTANSSVVIPDDIAQSGYTVTCYGEGGWYLGGGSEATSVAAGTNQKSVHEKWLADGARYKNGIAVMNVNGQDCYLIATAPTFGDVGDAVNVNFDDGKTIPCVIADAKSTNDGNYTQYGHGQSNGSVNVLEFEVDRNDYNSKGNPNTEGWGLEWDSNSDVHSIDNYGSVI